MSHIAFSRTDHSVTFFDSSLVSRTVASDHPNFIEIRDLLVAGAATLAELEDLINIKQAVTNFGAGRIEIRGDTVYLDGGVLHNALSRRMLEIMSAGGDFTPLANFQLSLLNNPSAQAVEELFEWIEASNLPILADGRFVAYKKVADDYSSFHSAPGGQKVYNRVGDTPSMPRNQVDDRRHNTCSRGLHFCSYSYLPSYYAGRGRVMVLAVDPANVVSIPNDYGFAKGRAWTYEVIGEVPEVVADDYFRGTPVVNSDLSAYEPPKDDDADYDAAEADAVDPTNITFVDSDGCDWTLDEIFETIRREGGKRAAARDMWVPESTLRGWVKPYEDLLEEYLADDLV